MEILAKVTAAITPGLSLLSYFYLKDQYEPEPLKLVLKMFMVGALVVFPIMILQYIMNPYLPGVFGQSFVVSGMMEEGIKWFLFYILIFGHTEFDEPYDGIVYSVAIAVGYATIENLFYIFLIKDSVLKLIWTRAFLPVSGHALFGVTMGYYFAKVKLGHGKKYAALSLLAPVVFHGIFNTLLHYSSFFALIMVVSFMIFLWIFSLLKANSMMNKV